VSTPANQLPTTPGLLEQNIGSAMASQPQTTSAAPKPMTFVGGSEDEKAGVSGKSSGTGDFTVDMTPYNEAISKLFGPGVTQQEVTDYVRQLPTAQGNQILEALDETTTQIAQPESTLDKIMQGLALTASIGAITAGAGGFIGSAAGLGLGATAGSIGGGAVGGAAQSILTTGGEDIGKDTLIGAAGGAAGAAAAPAAGAISETTGLPLGVSDVVAGAGLGAVKGEITGAGAEEGALGGGISGGVQASGLKQDITDATGSPMLGNVTSGLVSGELTSLAQSQLTSPSPAPGSGGTGGGSFSSGGGGQLDPDNPFGTAPAKATVNMSTPANQLPASVSNPTAAIPTAAAPAIGSTPTAAAPSSFGSDVVTGLESTLGGTSLGSAVGAAIPYAAVAGIGMAQANAGEAQAATLSGQQQALAAPSIGASNQLLQQYQSGTLNPTDAAVVNTGIAQGQSTIASASGLSAIAQTAFADYNSGTLKPGDQAALDAQVASQKQQVAQQLASAGITDSTILAAQYQNIDNQALITKQTILNGYFDTGDSAYNSWLSATTQGQAAITAAQTYASNSLQTYLTNSMQEANIGMGEVNTAIQTQMTTDAQYAAQVSTLMGTLATAYAKQIAGNASKSGTSSAGTTAANAAKAAAGGAGSSGSSSGSPAQPGDTSGGIDPTTGIPYDLESPSTGQLPPTATSPFDPNNTSFSLPSDSGDFNSVTDTMSPPVLNNSNLADLGSFP
jgi:hypothetical protein